MQTIEKIFVDPDDEIIFVVEKILRAATSRVILVIPASSGVVSSVISLKLLSRQLLDSNKLLVLVTDNPTGKKLAVKANLVVKDKISMVDKLAWEEALSIKKELQEHKEGIRTELLAARVPEKVEAEEIEEQQDTEADTAQTRPEQDLEVEEDADSEGEEHAASDQVSDQDESASEPEIFGEKPRLKPKMMEVGGIAVASGGDINELTAAEDQAASASHVNHAVAPVLAAKRHNEESRSGKYTQDPGTKKRTQGSETDSVRESDDSSKVADRRLKKTGLKPDKKKLKRILIILGIVLAVLLLLSGGVFAYSYRNLSQVEIEVTFNQSEGTINEVITVSTSARDVDGDNLIIPGYEVTLEESSSGDGTATGKKEVGEFAQGVIDIRNKSTESAVNLAAGQILVDISTNLQYELTQNVAIPVDQYQRDVPIKAREFGEKFNITDQQSTFRLEGFTTEQLIGFGFRDVTGGTTEEITVVTAEDVAKVKSDLETAMKGNLSTSLQSEIGRGEELLAGSERYEEVSFTQSVPTGEEAENFSIDLKMKVTAVKLRESDVKSLAEVIIKKSESATDEAEVKVDDFEIRNIKVEGSKITFELNAQGEVNENLELEKQKPEISGKSLSEAKDHLEKLEQIDKVVVTYKPEYIPESMKKIPNDPNRIKFK